MTTGILLLSYASGCALMLLLLGWFGARLISRLRGGQVISGRLRQLAGVAMLAAVALIASGSDRYLQGASGLTHRLEQRLSAFMPGINNEFVWSRSLRRGQPALCRNCKAVPHGLIARPLPMRR